MGNLFGNLKLLFESKLSLFPFIFFEFGALMPQIVDLVVEDQIIVDKGEITRKNFVQLS